MTATLASILPSLAPHLQALLIAQHDQLPAPPPALLINAGLLEDSGAITRKGARLLTHLHEIADLLDLPLA